MPFVSPVATRRTAEHKGANMAEDAKSDATDAVEEDLEASDETAEDVSGGQITPNYYSPYNVRPPRGR